METTLKDIYSRITQQIIQAIEEGAPAYRMPWHQSGAACCEPVNALTKRPYQGVNVLTLWATAQSKGFASGLWATYNQWQELGAQVRKGEKSALIVVWKEVQRENQDRKENEQERPELTEKRKGRLLLARGYYVFNAAQVDGYQADEQPPLSDELRIEQAERFFGRLGANIQHDGDRACNGGNGR